MILRFQTAKDAVNASLDRLPRTSKECPCCGVYLPTLSHLRSELEALQRGEDNPCVRFDIGRIQRRIAAYPTVTP